MSPLCCVVRLTRLSLPRTCGDEPWEADLMALDNQSAQPAGMSPAKEQ